LVEGQGKMICDPYMKGAKSHPDPTQDAASWGERGLVRKMRRGKEGRSERAIRGEKGSAIFYAERTCLRLKSAGSPSPLNMSRKRGLLPRRKRKTVRD